MSRSLGRQVDLTKLLTGEVSVPVTVAALVPQVEILGEVSSGCGVATSHLLACADELQQIVQGELHPGSLNVVLREPLALRAEAALKFGGGSRLLWRATFNGVDAWVYRWESAPLHVAEVLAPVHLRSTLSLKDGDHVTLAFERNQLAPITPLRRLLWCALWLGRRHRFYAHGSYFRWYARGVRMMERLRGAVERTKRVAKTVPLLSPVLSKVRATIFPGSARRHVFTRVEATAGLNHDERLVCQIQNLLSFTKTSGSAYSAQEYSAGYHTIEINGKRFAGQRDPAKRLELVPIDFRGKSVLDLGCNQGGMIHQIRDAVTWAVGVDYDPRMINAANKIRAVLGAENCGFFVLDLQKDPLDLIKDFLNDDRVDVCFLLAVCMWLDNWREVIDFAQTISREMVFETNGSAEQQAQQIANLRERYESVDILAEHSQDDPMQKSRKLLHLTRPRALSVRAAAKASRRNASA